MQDFNGNQQISDEDEEKEETGHETKLGSFYALAKQLAWRNNHNNAALSRYNEESPFYLTENSPASREIEEDQFEHQRSKKGFDSKHLMGAIRGNSQIPLSILDNIDTIRRGLLRELIMRRQREELLSNIQESENFKDRIGRR